MFQDSNSFCAESNAEAIWSIWSYFCWGDRNWDIICSILCLILGIGLLGKKWSQQDASGSFMTSILIFVAHVDGILPRVACFWCALAEGCSFNWPLGGWVLSPLHSPLRSVETQEFRFRPLCPLQSVQSLQAARANPSILSLWRSRRPSVSCMMSGAEKRCITWQKRYEEVWRGGYGSIPIHTIFSGMNIHLPAILMFTRGTRFWHTARWTWESFHIFPLLITVHLSTQCFQSCQSVTNDERQTCETPPCFCHLPYLSIPVLWTSRDFSFPLSRDWQSWGADSDSLAFTEHSCACHCAHSGNAPWFEDVWR